MDLTPREKASTTTSTATAAAAAAAAPSPSPVRAEGPAATGWGCFVARQVSREIPLDDPVEYGNAAARQGLVSGEMVLSASVMKDKHRRARRRRRRAKPARLDDERFAAAGLGGAAAVQVTVDPGAKPGQQGCHDDRGEEDERATGRARPGRWPPRTRPVEP